MYTVSPFIRLQHRRKSFRLKNYDYTKPDLYYLTMCCQERAHLFGTIEEGIMVHNPAGTMISEQWELLPQRFPHIQLHDFVVMPNHMHAVLEIINNQNTTTFTTENFTQSVGVGAALVAALPGLEEPDMGYSVEDAIIVKSANAENGLRRIIGAFKSITTVEYIRGVKAQEWEPFNKKVWQRNYWERIIRTESEYKTIRAYIRANPARWKRDCFQ